MRRIVPFLIAVATLAGCAGQTVSAATSTVPTPDPPAKVAPAVYAAPAPTVQNIGTNWPTVIGSMVAYGQWLLADPDPALVGVIASSRCASAEALTEELQALVDQDARVRTSAAVLTDVTGPSSVTGNRVVVRVVASRPAEPVVVRSHDGLSPSARTIWLEDKPQLSPTSLRVTLIRGVGDRWRFCSITDASVDPETEAITTLL